MFSEQFAIKPGTKVLLKNISTNNNSGQKKNEYEKTLEDNIKRMYQLQHLMYAEDKHAVLIVLQGMDTSGKDSTIMHVMRGMNPTGCTATSFKAPTPDEMDHDFLWRVHKAVPRIGEFGIFNRSFYEDVIMPNVHKTISKDILEKRYKQINDFEELLTENGTVLLKFFLHISKEEQKKRLLERINDPEKNWKIDPADLKERVLWDRYQKAYEEALEKCSTKRAPWYVIPADKKWARNLAVSRIIADKLESLDMKYPKAKYAKKDMVIV